MLELTGSERDTVHLNDPKRILGHFIFYQIQPPPPAKSMEAEHRLNQYSGCLIEPRKYIFVINIGQFSLSNRPFFEPKGNEKVFKWHRHCHKSSLLPKLWNLHQSRPFVINCTIFGHFTIHPSMSMGNERRLKRLKKFHYSLILETPKTMHLTQISAIVY